MLRKVIRSPSNAATPHYFQDSANHSSVMSVLNKPPYDSITLSIAHIDNTSSVTFNSFDQSNEIPNFGSNYNSAT